MQVPTLEKGDFKLFEIIAIASFLASSNKANLLGASDEDKALVQQYMSRPSIVPPSRNE